MKKHRFSILIPLLFAACTQTPAVTDNTTESRNKKIVQTYFNEAWNKGHLDVLDSILNENYINHTPSTPNPSKGPAGLKPIILAIRAGFPDLHYEIKDIIVTQDKAVARVIMTGTQTGVLFGIAPTGKHVEINQINIEKIENGKITEHWRVTDELAMMKQLGVVK
jgi:predicted ester cyclase